jgi:hypothetical protein
MKYIKRFESIKEDVKVGDYVIFKEISREYSPEYLNFLCNNIGVIKKIRKKFTRGIKIDVEFDKPFNTKYNDSGYFFTDEIEFISSNKEELQWILDAKKYNL